ncbi:MAG: hypothetical protein ACR2QO_20920 [Acidimicrobiales bacterium]
MPTTGWSRSRKFLVVAVIGALPAVAGACTGEDATPISPGDPAGVTTPHQLEVTDEMRELAEQQCLDDPTLDVGEIKAVDPANEEQVLATVTVECDTVR